MNQGVYMAEFKKEKYELFLGVVRKYMQLRGNWSQKDLADKCKIGISTISRLLNQKTHDLNPQMIATIVAVLNIPLHEIIEFVEEDYNDRFIKLVKVYREESEAGLMSPPTPEPSSMSTSSNTSSGEKTLKEKLEDLSPRQKAFLTDFLNVSNADRDLVVDVGNNLLSYFRQKSTKI
jgi:transcriptional regulator with XRE-family HTH domain